MSSSEYNTFHDSLRNLPITELANPEHRRSLLLFAGEIAVPCVAEAFMNVLKPLSKSSRMHPAAALNKANRPSCLAI